MVVMKRSLELSIASDRISIWEDTPDCSRSAGRVTLRTLLCAPLSRDMVIHIGSPARSTIAGT